MPDNSALQRALGIGVLARSEVSGGSINRAERLELADGGLVFVKSREGGRAEEFEAEAAALEWLAEAGGPSVPRILALGEAPPSLALEWIEPGAISNAGAERFGRALAKLHAAGAPAHGALPEAAPEPRLAIGPLVLPALPRETWAEVYAGDRLLPTLAAAVDRGALERSVVDAVQRVCERIGQLCGPDEAPSRLHGDLWSGNVLGAADGEAWLIDPAAYGGHREVDLAMLRLFGSPSERIFDAYHERAPLAEGHQERVELWQLFPLLVHAALFGGSYGASAGRVARRYT